MKQLPFYHVDAFTDIPFGGNPAGVVPNAEGLSEEEMQKIANELNLSETAFILPSLNENADLKIRYFTPSNEIDFCGHATVAAAWILASELRWDQKANEVKFETNIGVVPVQWTKNKGKLDSVSMKQVRPIVKDVPIIASELCRLIGIDKNDLDHNYPIKLGYTGNWHLLIPVKSRKAVDAACPLFEELKLMNVEHQIVTTHLFTFDSDGVDCDIYTRDFAPAAGILEDPVTGSANGALAGYLFLEGFLKSNLSHSFTIAQGHSINRPGYLEIKVESEKGLPVIYVGGKAVPIISGYFRL